MVCLDKKRTVIGQHHETVIVISAADPVNGSDNKFFLRKNLRQDNRYGRMHGVEDRVLIQTLEVKNITYPFIIRLSP